MYIKNPNVFIVGDEVGTEDVHRQRKISTNLFNSCEMIFPNELYRLVL